MAEYLILGACNPQPAGRALSIDREAGCLLPRIVVVRADRTGVLVEATDPTLLAEVLARPERAEPAEAARRLLAAVVADLAHPAAAAG
ncbi:DUF302 domain-containing protein [Nocardia sp. NPDC004860]|uniref:DUF302 domain-containing protein n=1 Tax=Nocardia sp. NPDC004860 TaxID=3154557 RepID=UPI0033A66303